MTDDDRLRSLYQAAPGRRSDGGDAPAPEQLDALAAGRLPEAEAFALMDRVMADPELRREYELLRSIHAAGRSAERRRVPAWLALAATVLLAVSAALIWRSLRDGEPAVIRGGGVVQLAGPGPAASVAAPVVLTWRSVDGALRYRVEVLGPDGRAAVAMETADTSVTVAPDRLAPGAAYRWWVEVRTAGSSARSEVREFTVAAP